MSKAPAVRVKAFRFTEREAALLSAIAVQEQRSMTNVMRLALSFYAQENHPELGSFGLSAIRTIEAIKRDEIDGFADVPMQAWSEWREEDIEDYFLERNNQRARRKAQS